MQDTFADLKGRSKRKNIRIDSTNDVKNETWEKCGEEVLI